MARKRGRPPAGGFRTFPKRASLWVPFEVFNNLTTAGSRIESGDLLGNYFSQTGEEVPIGSTLGPIRWTCMFSPNADTQALELDYRAEMVMQLNREGGRATLATPGVDIIDAPWYGVMVYTGQLIESAAGTFKAPAVAKDFRTDAMRKVAGNGQTLTITAVGSGSVDMNLRHLGHVFLKLP